MVLFWNPDFKTLYVQKQIFCYLLYVKWKWSLNLHFLSIICLYVFIKTLSWLKQKMLDMNDNTLKLSWKVLISPKKSFILYCFLSKQKYSLISSNILPIFLYISFSSTTFLLTSPTKLWHCQGKWILKKQNWIFFAL